MRGVTSLIRIHIIIKFFRFHVSASVSDTNTSSGQQKQGTRVSTPLGMCFRCNWNAALVCARKFPLSHMHQALSVTSSARGVSSQEALFHSSRILLWMGLQAAVATTIATSSDANLTWVKNLHFPIGVSFGKDEKQPGADGKVYNVAYVVSQLAPEGSLQDAYFSSAETRISLKPDEKVSILLDVATALRALHSAGAHTVRKIRLNCCGYVCTYVCVCMYALIPSQLHLFHAL